MDKTMITKATIIKAIQQFLVEQNHKKSEADRKKLENANLSDKEELQQKQQQLHDTNVLLEKENQKLFSLPTK